MARQRKKASFTMEIAPVNLIDLVLILLIFFITTTTFLNLKVIELALPKADAAPVPRSERALAISIDAKGVIFADKHQANPELEVVIAADAKSLYEAFVAVVWAVQKEEIKKVGMVTEKGEK